jgi:hypothetical protein
LAQKWNDDCEEMDESKATRVTEKGRRRKNEEGGKEREIAQEAQGPEEQMDVSIY